MKNFYITFFAQLNGKYWAGTMTVSSDDNIMNISQKIAGMQAANLCATKKPLKSWRIIGMSVLNVTGRAFTRRA